MAFQTKEVSAEQSDRMNQQKKKYFRLDVSVGKLEIHNLDDLLSEEDLLCLKMREQYLDWENQVSLAMIPFYTQRLEHLLGAIDEARYQHAPREELVFLEKTRDDMEANLKREKDELQQKAQTLYDTWLTIEELRKKNNYTSATAHLIVFKKEIGG